MLFQKADPGVEKGGARVQGVDGERRCPLLECRLSLQEARVPCRLPKCWPGVDPMGEGMGQGKKSEPV